MATFVGFAMIVIVLGTLVTRRLSPLVAFTAIPIAAGLALGYGPAALGAAMEAGVSAVAPTVALFVFAILYFGLMRERGLFEPVVQFAVRVIDGKPVRLTVATVLLAAIAHLDGAGATTFLLTIPALLPIYDRLRMRRVVLLMLIGISAGVMNLVPWGGTVVRAAISLDLDAGDIWRGLIPVQLFGLVLALVVAVTVGVRESRLAARLAPVTESLGHREPALVAGGTSRLGQRGRASSGPAGGDHDALATVPEEPDAVEDKSGHLSPRSWRYRANLVLTVGLLVALFAELFPLHICFIIAFGIALAINCGTPALQDASVRRNAPEALYMAAVLLGVGIFLGILNGTAMMPGITDALSSLVPAQAAGISHLIFGLFATPLDLVLGADPFAFGLLPVVDSVATSGGTDSYSTARALLIGQNAGFAISPMVPSVYLALGLAKVSLGDHIRFSLPWLWAAGVLMLGFAVLVGAVTF